MAILHILDHALPEVSGYSVRSHALLRAQRAAGIDAMAVAHSEGRDSPRESIDGVPYLRIPRLPGSATPRSGVQRMVGLARFLSELVRRESIELLHAHSPSLNGVPALWVARRNGLPVVYEMRALWEAAAVERNLQTARSMRSRSTRALETWLMRRVSGLAVISEGLRDEAMRRGVVPEKIFKVPNGVDCQSFHPIPKDLELSRRLNIGDDIVIGYLGFFLAYEGVDVLLRAFAQLAAAAPRVRLLLIGAGEEEIGLRALTTQLGLGSRVTFAGAAPHAEVQTWYSLCDILVYPRCRGRNTTLVTPLKPLEAMAMGKAVVASDVGGLRELIRDGQTGLLCAPQDSAALAVALGALSADKAQREALGQQARDFVCAERDWQHLGPVYAAAYRKLLAGADPSAVD